MKHDNAHLPDLGEKHATLYDPRIRFFAITATLMLVWLYLWALVLKLGDETVLIRNYINLSAMTVRERIEWDLIPFNYRGTDYWIMRQKIDTLLNCFVFAPFGILFSYLFQKRNILRDAVLCLLFSVTIEATQLLTLLGNPATEDLITNVAGCFIGYALYSLFFARMSVEKGRRLFLVANLLLGGLCVFSFYTTAKAAPLILQILTGTY